MNTVHKFYNLIDGSGYDATKMDCIENEIEESFMTAGDEISKKNLIREMNAFSCKKAFHYKDDEQEGTANGLSNNLHIATEINGMPVSFYYPDVRNFSDEDYLYYEDRYRSCKNLFAKTEYGLIVYFGQRTQFSKMDSFKKELSNHLFTLSQSYLKTLQEAGSSLYNTYYSLTNELYLQMVK